mmetsp:Transcript_11307/g.21563  ORF Transcript_11307/g.21563 Transcript_11307/m.21563 type:complete len:246 (+) Transcript_11307:154-891(+)
MNFSLDDLNDRPVCGGNNESSSSSAECHSPTHARFPVEASPSEDFSSGSFGYEHEQDTQPKQARNVVGEGLAPRRRSLARSDCRETKELSPGLQFSLRKSLSRSDHKSISSFDSDDEKDVKTSPQRGRTRRRSSVQALLQQMVTPVSPLSSAQRSVTRHSSMAGVRNRTSSLFVDAKDATQNASPPSRSGVARCASTSPQRGATRWCSMEETFMVETKSRHRQLCDNNMMNSVQTNATPPRRTSK